MQEDVQNYRRRPQRGENDLGKGACARTLSAINSHSLPNPNPSTSILFLPRASYPLLTIGEPQKRVYNPRHVAPHGLFCQNDSRQRFACRVNFADKYIKSWITLRNRRRKTFFRIGARSSAGSRRCPLNAPWPHRRNTLYATSPSDSIVALVANFPLGSRSMSKSVLISE